MSKKAFTLVELMIVIAIIGILAAALFPMMSIYMARSRDTQRVSDLKKIRQALTGYYTDTGRYPITSGWWATDTVSTYDPSLTYWNQLQTALTSYIRLPHDPTPVGDTGPWYLGNYRYAYRSINGSTLNPVDYDLVAQLETNEHALSCKKQYYKYHIGDNPAQAGSCWCGAAAPECVGSGETLSWSKNMLADH